MPAVNFQTVIQTKIYIRTFSCFFEIRALGRFLSLYRVIFCVIVGEGVLIYISEVLYVVCCRELLKSYPYL